MAFGSDLPPKLHAADLVGDYVVSGFQPTVPDPAALSMGIPAGVAYANGKRVSKGAEPARAYAVSSDTYVDLSDAGVFTYPAVANGAAAPAVTANSIRLFKVVTNASVITTIVDQRLLRPVVKGHNHLWADITNPAHSHLYADITNPPYIPGTPELLLEYVVTTDIFNNTTFAAETWRDIHADQSFTKVRANSSIWVVVAANVFSNTVNISVASAVLMNGTTRRIVGGVRTQGNFFSGTCQALFTGLAAGVHNVRSQVYPASSCAAFCRAATIPIGEHYHMRVYEIG